jgi:two-component system OmpR family sensor kinase
VSLRGRLAAVSSAVALVTLGGAFAAVWLAYGGAQERQLDATLLREARSDAVEASWSEVPAPAGHLVLRRAELDPIPKYGVIYDAAGNATAWSPHLERGRPRVEAIGRPNGVPFDMWWSNEHLRAAFVPVPGTAGYGLLLATPRTDLDADASDLARRMAGAVALAVVASAAAASWLARILTRDHERIAAVARAVAAGDLGARIGVTSRDEEMQQLGRDVDEMIARLALLVETQERFIANASHELRSPLTTLLGELSFALRKERTAADYRASIEEALNATRRLKVLTEDLLALARIGAPEMDRDVVSLAEVTQMALHGSRAAAEAGGIALEVACDGAAVEGRAGDIERLLRNLVENAVRHSPRGGRVRIEASRAADDVEVVVSDEGPGVPEEVRERIFEPFFRLPGVRADHTGTGLGLTIGRSIARAHGGDLWADPSAPGGSGARFVVRLPASRPAPAGPV